MAPAGHSYPVDDGDITVVGRLQQIVVAVWVLGFMAGPLPAIIAMMVRPGRGVYRRLVVAAAVFWALAWLIGAASVWFAVRTGSMWFMAGWVGVMVVAFAATGIAAWLAVRRI